MVAPFFLRYEIRPSDRFSGGYCGLAGRFAADGPAHPEEDCTG
jgi:hypothetical protein